MIEQVREIVEIAGGVIEAFAAAVIVFGFLRALANYPGVRRTKDPVAAFDTFRKERREPMPATISIKDREGCEACCKAQVTASSAP